MQLLSVVFQKDFVSLVSLVLSFDTKFRDISFMRAPFETNGALFIADMHCRL